MPTYDAFISYNSADRKFAKILETALENYRPPKSIRQESKHLNIFRFEGDMFGVEYHKAIEKHLLDSTKLIVLCSPDAANSKYVKGEIELFAKHKDPTNIITVLVRGIPSNEVSEQNADQNAFPAIISQLQKMPLAKDFRGFDHKKDKVNKGAFIHSWHKLLADLLDKPIDEIIEKETKRRIKKRNTAIGIVGAVSVILAILLIFAVFQRNRANENAELALKNERTAKENEAKEKSERIRADNNAEKERQQRLRADSITLEEIKQRLRADSIAVAEITQRKRADSNANVARSEKERADINAENERTQRNRADSIAREEIRKNSILKAENTALKVIDEIDRGTFRQEDTFRDAINAYNIYRDSSKYDYVDQSKEQYIYQALLAVGNFPKIQTAFEPKHLTFIDNRLFAFGYDPMQKINLASTVDPELRSNWLNIPIRSSAPINFCQFLPGIGKLITCNDRNMVEIRDYNNAEFVTVAEFENCTPSYLRNILFDQENGLTAMAGAEGGFCISANNLQGKLTVDSLENFSFTSVAGFAYLEKHPVIVGKDNTLLRFDPLSGTTESFTFSDASDQSTVCEFSPERGLLFIGHESGSISVLDMNGDFKFIGDIPNSGKTRIEYLQYHPEEDLLTAANSSGILFIWDCNFIREVFYQPRKILHPKKKIRAVTAESQYLYVALSDKTLIRYDMDINRFAKAIIQNRQPELLTNK